MLKIEVISTEVRQVVKKATGEIFQIPEVSAYVHDVEKYPVAIKFGVPKGQQPPPPGFYQLQPSSFFAGKFGALTVKSQLVLGPLNEPPRKGV